MGVRLGSLAIWPALQPAAIMVFMALYSGASALLDRPVPRDVELAFAAPVLRKTMQVMGPSDLSPSSGPSRKVPERSTAGQQEATAVSGSFQGRRWPFPGCRGVMLCPGLVPARQTRS